MFMENIKINFITILDKYFKEIKKRNVEKYIHRE